MVAVLGRGLVGNIMRGTICVVESDHIVRLYVVRLLEEEGFHVVDFDSADRALIHLGRHAAGVIMILTAADLPGTFSGPDLVRVASISWPWITVVVAKEMGSGNLDLPEVVITISKPIQDDDVLACASLAEAKGHDPANLDFEI
jgi:FixJ family two-component response regulator